jgi:hypothetical protein
MEPKYYSNLADILLHLRHTSTRSVPRALAARDLTYPLSILNVIERMFHISKEFHWLSRFLAWYPLKFEGQTYTMYTHSLHKTSFRKRLIPAVTNKWKLRFYLEIIRSTLGCFVIIKELCLFSNTQRDNVLN